MTRSAAPAPIDDLGAWLNTFLQPGALIELGALVTCVGLSWGLVRGLQRAFNPDAERSIWFGRRGIDGVLFPLLLLVLAYGARALTVLWVPLAVWRVAIPALLALVVIRIGVKVLEVAFRGASWLRPVERTVSWLAW